MPRRRILSPEQHRELLRRYALWRENMPKRIASDLGIHRKRLNDYLRKEVKDNG